MPAKNKPVAPALRARKSLQVESIEQLAQLLKGTSPAQQVVEYIHDLRAFLDTDEAAEIRDDMLRLLAVLTNAISRDDTPSAVLAAARLGEYRFWPGAVEAMRIDAQRAAARTKAAEARRLIGNVTAVRVAGEIKEKGRPQTVSDRQARRLKKKS